MFLDNNNYFFKNKFCFRQSKSTNNAQYLVNKHVHENFNKKNYCMTRIF